MGKKLKLLIALLVTILLLVGLLIGYVLWGADSNNTDNVEDTDNQKQAQD